MIRGYFLCPYFNVNDSLDSHCISWQRMKPKARLKTLTIKRCQARQLDLVVGSYSKEISQKVLPKILLPSCCKHLQMLNMWFMAAMWLDAIISTHIAAPKYTKCPCTPYATPAASEVGTGSQRLSCCHILQLIHKLFFIFIHVSIFPFRWTQVALPAKPSNWLINEVGFIVNLTHSQLEQYNKKCELTLNLLYWL